MKRFFQPAVPDPSKRAKGSGDDPTASGGTAGCAVGERRSDPRSFVTWNANSLLGRLRKQPDKDALFEYLRKKDLPDVICVQETWLPAAAPNRYVLAPPPSGPVPTFITTSSPVASSRIIRRSDPSRRLPLTRRGTLKDDTKAAREDAALIHLCLRQKPLSAYRPYWSCADAKRAGCAVLVKKDVEVVSVRRSLTGGTSGDSQDVAHDEGRVLLLEFGTFVLLNTYAQNNGWTEESFAKRRRWDAELAAFVRGDATGGATRRPRFDSSDSDSADCPKPAEV